MKRIAVLAVAVLASLTLAATSLAHTSRRHRPRGGWKLRPARPGDPVEPGDAEGARGAGRPTGLDSSDPHDGDHPDRRVRRRQRDPRGGEPLLVDFRGPRRRLTDAAAPRRPREPRSTRCFQARPAIDAVLQDSLAQIGSGERVERGIRFGERRWQTPCWPPAPTTAPTPPPRVHTGLRTRRVSADPAELPAAGLHADRRTSRRSCFAARPVPPASARRPCRALATPTTSTR